VLLADKEGVLVVGWRVGVFSFFYAEPPEKEFGNEDKED
jgi:hypothetical protein